VTHRFNSQRATGTRLNTQAHLLLAAALLARSSNAGPNKVDQANGTKANHGLINIAVVIGALVPDVSLFIMFGQARLRGISHDVIWRELYYSAFWQNIGAITNSIPLFALLVMIGFVARKYNATTASALMVFGLAALLHCIADLPLHVDDGHAHFWPFSQFIFASPVSYWDPKHYGLVWQPIEFLIAAVATVVLWRRFTSRWVRALTLLGVLMYPVLFLAWYVK